MSARFFAGSALLVGAVVLVTLQVRRREPALRPMAEPLGAPILDPGQEVAFVCPLHPDYTSEKPGECPRDGMTLVPANPYDAREYRLELESSPPVVRAGEPATLTFRIFHPGTGEEIRDLVTVHDRPYHLFVVSQDLEHFEHVHPTRGADGAWSVDVLLPREGYYEVFSDFVPYGGSSQFIARPLVTAAYEGDLTGDGAALVPSVSADVTYRDLTARVSRDPETFVAGLYGHLRFEISESRSGRPVTDLEPYLGSFGHIVIMSEDLLRYVHSHPLDLENSDEETGPLALMLPMDADPARLRGGPVVTFEGLMPKPGRYRAWAQFQRDGEVYTFAYTFDVAATEAAQ